ncbi:translation elongation factor P-related protein [Klebsiella aerogenes]|nr:translation elongation factor P-related protein [Klebsiella aerogenes]
MTLTRRFVDFSYVDGNEYVFMDKEDYTPYTFTKEQIEEELQFIPEGGMPDIAGADLGRPAASPGAAADC